MNKKLTSHFAGMLAFLLCGEIANFSAQAADNASRPDASAGEVDPIEKEFQTLLEMDEAALEEAERMIDEVRALKAKASNEFNVAEATLSARIDQRLSPVKSAYDGFLRRHPDHARAELAYGSFLLEIGEPEEGVRHMEKAREIDPKYPAAWNNLANHYGHVGPVKKAFDYYAKAIELNPAEPVYLQNLATTVYPFRKDAKEHYHLNEEEVFNKALDLYRQAIKLDPSNFELATDLAQSYYGIRPLRADEALQAWESALKIARDDVEREGIYLHLARVELNSGRFDDARRHLDKVANEAHRALKDRLVRNLETKEREANEKNSADDNKDTTASSSAVQPESLRPD